MIYEMRVYSCVPGGMPGLLKRFESSTLRIWERIGLRPVGFFTTLVGPSNHDLTYFLAWESLEERERLWETFASDPEWLGARAAHQEEHGEVVANIASSFLAPTAFSAMR
ncbi:MULTISPECIES: NIPSNAP family protein [Aliiruegeria]|uniref:NIPSNAP protein n=1 Tax=Aliiruegeria lutimaris TaxID=571298 RepID=A0A1G9JLN3_9RHOB|nr:MULTISPECIES: NIPSNAP family protein [Aliiruegeria]NDR56697.1 NIPSNAP family protein [Pseudoruegeria sp. M32A2M]SDL38222.1 NIPSNAP protein [Aliiruegeria lutimaris]